MRAQQHGPCLLLLLAMAISLVGRGALIAASNEVVAPAEPVFVPIPKTPWPGFSDMVIEPGGTVWIMANNKVFYWAGTEFREPVSGPMQSGYYLAGLYGGPDRGAYATLRGEREHEGQIYKLSDGAASPVASFYYEVAHEYPGLYVSRSGILFNWGYSPAIADRHFENADRGASTSENAGMSFSFFSSWQHGMTHQIR